MSNLKKKQTSEVKNVSKSSAPVQKKKVQKAFHFSKPIAMIVYAESYQKAVELYKKEVELRTSN